MRPAGSARTRAHGHMDVRTHGHTGLRAALGALQGAQLRCGTAPAGLRTGPGRGGVEGEHSNTATPAAPLRTPRRTQSGGCGASPLPGALPGAARPRSPFPKVTARRGAHLAGGQAPGCSRPRGSPTLLSTGCCVGPAGGVEGGLQESGPGGAERAPRGAAPPPRPPSSHPTLGTCAALRGQLAGAARQRVHRAAPPAPHGTAPPLPPAECTPRPVPGL